MARRRARCGSGQWRRPSKGLCKRWRRRRRRRQWRVRWRQQLHVASRPVGGTRPRPRRAQLVRGTVQLGRWVGKRRRRRGRRGWRRSRRKSTRDARRRRHAACALHAHCVCTACALHAHCMCIACPPCMHSSYTEASVEDGVAPRRAGALAAVAGEAGRSARRETGAPAALRNPEPPIL